MKNKLKEELNARLSGLTMSEALKRCVLDKVRKEEEPVMKRKISLSAAIAIALMAVAAVAFALTDGFGLFDQMGQGKREEFSVVQKEAYDLVQKNLASVNFEHVDVTVTEAVYDGKFLRIAFSTKERDANAPFDDDKVYNGDFSFEAAQKDGVWWVGLDWAIVNGMKVYPLGESGVNAGERNGETVAWIQYDLSALEIGDELTVDLPIRGEQSIDNKELGFTMSVKNLIGVRRISPIPDVRFSDYSLHLEEMLISPIRIYIRVEMTMDAGVTADRCDEVRKQWAWKGFLTGEGDDKPFTESGGSSGFIDATTPNRFMVEFEFLTRESYPDTFILTNGVDSLYIPNETPIKN